MPSPATPNTATGGVGGVPRRRTAASSSSKSRPTSGGLAIGFTAEELAAQAAKRAAWMQSEVKERIALKKKVEEEDEKSSDSALRILLIVRATPLTLTLNPSSAVQQHGPSTPSLLRIADLMDETSFLFLSSHLSQFWLFAIFAIFYHVYHTIQRGVEHMANNSNEFDIPASEGIFKAFQQKTI